MPIDIPPSLPTPEAVAAEQPCGAPSWRELCQGACLFPGPKSNDCRRAKMIAALQERDRAWATALTAAREAGRLAGITDAATLADVAMKAADEAPTYDDHSTCWADAAATTAQGIAEAIRALASAPGRVEEKEGG